MNSSLQARCDIANSSNADYFISIHCNANTNVDANGTEVYCYKFGGKAEKLAKLVNSEIVNSLPLFNRGIKEGNFAVLRNTNMPAILVETAFITNYDDSQILCNKQNEIANSIFVAICRYLGINISEVNTMAKVTFIGEGKNIKATVDGNEIMFDELIENNGRTTCVDTAKLLKALGHEVDWKAE